MKWFKKILAIAALMFISSFAYSQSGQIYINSSNYYQWVKVSNSQCNKASFYVYVDRTYNSASRLYYYNIYIWSDSYYRDCSASSTYIENINVYGYNGSGYSKIFGQPYLLAKPKNNYFNGWNFLGYVYSQNSKLSIKIKWGSVSLY